MKPPWSFCGINIIAILLAGFLLATTHRAFGQSLDEANALDQQVNQLYSEGRYSDATPLAERALAIRERILNPDHPDIAASLNYLALLYYEQGRYADAEPLYKRSLPIFEKALGSDHPDFATSLNNLALLFSAQGRYVDAEPLYKRSLAIRENALGPDHLDVANSLKNLAELYFVQGRYADAEPLYKRSLTIRERVFGPDHPRIVAPLYGLAGLYSAQGRYADAEPLYKRSLTILDKAFAPDHPDVAASLSGLAILYKHQGRYADAEPLNKRLLTIDEKAFGPDHPRVATSLNNLAELYYEQGRYADAEPLYKRSLTIKERVFGPDHPKVALSLSNLAALYSAQGRYADAEPLYKRSLTIRERAFGPDHPDVAASLHNLAALYLAEHSFVDAEPLYKRSLAIWERALGPDHPYVATSLNSLATLYLAQGRYADALSIVKRTISQNSLKKFVALAVLDRSQSQNLITPIQALNLSYKVLQHSASSAAGEAIAKLAARFAAASNDLAQFVRKDQDLTAEAIGLDNAIIGAVSKSPADRNATAEEQMRKRIDEVKSERDKLQDILNRRFPDYVALSKPQTLSVEQTQTLLADDEALIVVDLDENSYVWVITKNQAVWKALWLISAEDASKRVRMLRPALDPSSLTPFDPRVAYQLYQRILGPIEEIISHKTRLSFVLSGALTSLPPQVLIISPPEGRNLASLDWLGRKYAITVLPSVASLKVLRSQKFVASPNKPLLGYGDPVFNRTAPIAPKQIVASLNSNPCPN